MPLHKPKGLGAYQQQLSYCVTQVRSSLTRFIYQMRTSG